VTGEDWHHILPLLLAAAIIVGTVLVILIQFLRGVRSGMDDAETAYRRQTNRCLKCGYRMTGNVSGVCPECGAARTLVPPHGNP
jgi:hypothetical protein